MITSRDCIDYFGTPVNGAEWLTLFNVHKDLQIGAIPRRIYCNKLIVKPLKFAFANLISRGYAESELVTWDGCFNIRKIRGRNSWSLHSWAIAVDMNAFENQYGKPGNMTQGMADCFIDAGFDWGAGWKKPDAMHFQLAKFPS